MVYAVQVPKTNVPYTLHLELLYFIFLGVILIFPFGFSESFSLSSLTWSNTKEKYFPSRENLHPTILK